MRIFILGPTGSGKSYLANLLSKELGIPIIEGSAWIRTLTGRWDHGPEAAAFLSERSQELLKEDPDISLQTLQKLVGASESCIVVGLRNPVDFHGLCDCERCIIEMTGLPVTEFEQQGLEAIFKIADPDIVLKAPNYKLEDVLEGITNVEQLYQCT
jgi:energy-coupling factor transporter ATP-binding protein EcfA2